MSNLVLPKDFVDGSLYTESKENQLLNSYLEFNPLSSDIIDSYHDFIYKDIKERLLIPFYDMYGKRAYFKDVSYMPPKLRNSESLMFPLVARELNANYESEMIGHLVYEQYEGDNIGIIEEGEVSLGYLPVMIGSDLDNAKNREEDVGECPNDAIGYFIITGNEYVVMCQQQLRYNTFFVFPPRDSEYPGGTLKNLTPYKSINNSFNVDILRIIRISTDNIQDITLINHYDESLYKRRGLNYLHIIRILWNIKPDDAIDEIISKVSPNIQYKVREILEYGKLEPFDNNFTWVNDVTFLSNQNLSLFQRRRRGRELLNKEFLPNIKDTNSKYITLQYMIIKYVLCILGEHPLDSMDSWSCSQATSPGMLLMSFFNTQWQNAIGGRYTNERSLELINRTNSLIVNENIQDPLNTDILSFENLKSFIATKFGKNYISEQMTKGFNKNTFNLISGDSTDNATQILKRGSTISAKAHINRIVVRSTKKGNMAIKRMVHMSQAGYVCVADTPEGDQCGLVKAKAIGARIAIKYDNDLILNKLYTILQEYGDNTIPVFLNMEFLGYGDKRNVINSMREIRMESILDMGITYEMTGIYINTTPGRLVRPLLIVENGDVLIDKYDLWGQPFETLLENKVVEYIDAREQDYGIYYENGVEKQLLIADVITNVNLNTTHCELDPSAILGISASIIPLVNHNQGPRVSYQCNMGNQALGLFTGNNRYRLDAEAKQLAFPSPPILTTQSSKFLGLEKMPAGNTIMLAIGTFEGFNQEDAIVVNKAAIDRGLFMTIIYKTPRLEINSSSKSKSFIDVVSIPKVNDGVVRRKDANFSKLDPQGLIKVGSLVSENDCLACAYRSTNIDGGIRKRDISLYAGSDHAGMIVDRVLYAQSYKDTMIISVKLRRYKRLTVGDKIASRSAQKSIIGKVVAMDDMPYTANGEIPTMIMNPLAIPSRMTMAQILEMLLGKAAIMIGSRINGSMMSNLDIGKFKKILESYNFSTNGEEVFYDGKTGKQTVTTVYYGPAYYQALSHQVDYKIQSRQIGPIERQTKQAVSGRAKGGGIKVGNMEVSALIAHGAMNVLQDRLCSSSGTVQVVSCFDCGNVISSTTHVSGSQHVCRRCVDPNRRMVVQEISPAAMYFKDYIASGGLRLDFRSNVD